MEGLKQDLGSLIDSVDLDEIQRRSLRSRWLDQVLWMENRARRVRRRYYTVRLLAALGGVIVPTLVSLGGTGTRATVVRAFAIGLSLLVAMSVAVEEVVRLGEQFRHYRRTVARILLIARRTRRSPLGWRESSSRASRSTSPTWSRRRRRRRRGPRPVSYAAGTEIVATSP
jgi:hypothetical protein